MARVDFYILDEADAGARRRLACRLAEKAFAQSSRVLMLTADDEEARQLDDLLWTFRDRSFVPHELATPGRTSAAPVLIGTPESASGASADILINVSDRMPDDIARFARIVEAVDGEPARRQAGRDRYRAYRERGLAPESHNVGASHEV
ncbi:MAG TPA: DNA polymerase III subunit chi [Steroidobacteraceae bacterium]|nr:DNA polymerase III subunit chi [Steroidobacteraceae bacterium]